MKSLTKTFSTSLMCLILAIATAAQEAQLLTSESAIRNNACPLVDDPAHPVYLPYPLDCNKYYSCKNGLAYDMRCPYNLHWSPNTYRCDYPEVAGCIYAVPNEPTPPPPIYPVPIPEELLYQPYTGDCNKFYQCEAMHCPPGQHWNTRLRRCDFPSNAGCEYPYFRPTVMPPIEIPTAATPPALAPATVPTVPSVPSENPIDAAQLDKLCSGIGATFLRYPNDCSKYIQCNGSAFVHSCPGKLLWNAELLTCDRHCKP